MKEDSWYEEWKRRRSQEPASPGFTDRVMAALAAEAARRQRSAPTALLLVFWSSRLSRIGICSLAAAACVLRLAHVVAIFVAQ